MPANHVDAVIIPVSASALEGHVRELAEDIGERHVGRPQSLAAARDYISSQWQTEGHAVEFQEYDALGVPCANLSVALPGIRWPGQVVLMGAHYDTVPRSPGADDNASGVAALLQLSRRLSGCRPSRTIRLVASVNEEPPFFFWEQMGSAIYARAARQRGVDIRAMFSLEMLGCYRDEPRSQQYPPFLGRGRPDRGNFIAFVTNIRSRRLLKYALAAFKVGTDFPVEGTATFGWLPGVSWSDHINFWRQGYPALMITDTAFFRYPHYHSLQDTPEKLDYRRMAAVVEGLARMLIRLADDECL
ncbi:M28 family peptidase [Nitrosovibrio tenuis]|uniref:Peptidase family M28 n=1 Tax=Nitrosovibrio tenuis TaxID=1233 RepID=A0A1H7K3I4_9PROT|nr:M28 family peptidase [Nitrosovibrio tenuis]SEK81379.1 Peptidase family M28 [Nitrosovibrio tenuis]